METSKLIELLSYTLPAIITGVVAYYFFNLHTKNEERRRRYLLNKDTQKDSLPLRLQAFERMTLFLERINPGKLLIRISPNSEDKNEYENLLISQIEQEFEHNLTQQIYMSDECWTVIITAKNATIQMIRRTNMSERVDTANKLREVIMNDLMDKQSPSAVALSYIKNEVKYLF
ncbi:MAG: hypothetical protein EBR38_07925 [Flavobacteriaceae bacterium]|jgi:hypothetical protein|nr:hypothetical protein [Flavobacteriaceae bacterium]